MEVWFTELQYSGLKITCKVLQTLHREMSPFQEIVVLDTEMFGRMLVLDGAIQATIADEFVYHEMLAHVPVCSHPDPKDVLIIGGGDGGCAREVLRHQQIGSVTQVEIDRRVVDVSRHFLPELACSFDNPRMSVCFEDGIAFVKDKEACYDVILVDAPDPVGMAAGLFSREFYESLYQALRPDGIFASQTESPFFNKDLINKVYGGVSSIFPITGLYLANVPTYPSGLWSFTIGSKKYDPAQGPTETAGSMAGQGLRYYTPEVHRAAFALPPFVQALLRYGDTPRAGVPASAGRAPGECPR